jgi:hypothetical protein
VAARHLHAVNGLPRLVDDLEQLRRLDLLSHPAQGRAAARTNDREWERKREVHA